MTSRQQYYERKEAGLCTKCANPLDGESSTTRCRDCYQKFKESKQKSKETKIENGLCLTCGINAAEGHSNYCHNCRKENTDLKRQYEINRETVKFNPNNKNCRVCDAEITTIGVLCKSCLVKTTFTKKDAITRYGNKCTHCEEADLDNLRLASKDIRQPMLHHSLELYKHVCFSTSTPPEYKIICHVCYWKENLAYISNLRNFLENEYANKDDTIDIDDYEITDDSSSSSL